MFPTDPHPERRMMLNKRGRPLARTIPRIFRVAKIPVYEALLVPGRSRSTDVRSVLDLGMLEPFLPPPARW